MRRLLKTVLIAALTAPIGLATPALAQDVPRMLSGVDGSHAQLKITRRDGLKKAVEICARNPAFRSRTNGVSMIGKTPIRVLPGETRCFVTAPAQQMFVLWAFPGAQPAVRSISVPLDLTRYGGHVVWFEWMDGG